MEQNFNHLVAAGINYHKTDIDLRSKFAFTEDQYGSVYRSNQSDGKSFFILSTCNRTEIYGMNTSAEELVAILANHSKTEPHQLAEHIFVKKGTEVMDHLFRVAGGLDSQITGDYEVSGQLKSAFSMAKAHGMTDGYLEKLVNMALHISKRIKNETKLSDGTSSAAYVVIQLLKKLKLNNSKSRICLVGLGKIGTGTLKNLRDYLPDTMLTLVNRNDTLSIDAAEQFGVDCMPFADLTVAIKDAHAIIIATSAEKPVLLAQHLENSNAKLVFDLSVPNNAEKEIGNLPGVQLFNIDQLSGMVNANMSARKKEIPKAETIIGEQLAELVEWHERRMKYIGK